MGEIQHINLYGADAASYSSVRNSFVERVSMLQDFGHEADDIHLRYGAPKEIPTPKPPKHTALLDEEMATALKEAEPDKAPLPDECLYMKTRSSWSFNPYTLIMRILKYRLSKNKMKSLLNDEFQKFNVGGQKMGDYVFRNLSRQHSWRINHETITAIDHLIQKGLETLAEQSGKEGLKAAVEKHGKLIYDLHELERPGLVSGNIDMIRDHRTAVDEIRKDLHAYA